MASRSGRRRVDHSSPLVDLDDVFADDALIDAIAAGPWGADHGADRVLPANGRHGTPEPITELFDNWRRELALTPIPDLPAIPKTVVSAERARPRRSHRPALAVAAAIAALLVGSTFVGSRQATEGSALWNVTAVLWPDRVESVASRDKVRTAIQVARVALNEGRPADAQAALLGASFEIGKVDDTDGRQDLQSSLEGLWKQAAPPDSDPTPADQGQLVAGSSSSATARSTTTTAAQQLAAVELAVPTVPTGVQIAAPEVPTAGPGSTALVGVVGSPVGAGSGGLAVGSAAGTVDPPGNAGEVVVSASDTPTVSAEPPVTPESPSVDEPTGQPPVSATEPAPAPTPTLPTPTVNSPGSVTETGVGAAGAAPSVTDLSSTDTSDSTAVLPTP
jgi:hypothetical protein